MIKNIHLKNFKSHMDLNIELGNLTILSGQNGVGKSSIIQSLLLLRQTHQKNRLEKALDLNSPLCFLGKINNVIYYFSDKNSKSKLDITLTDESKSYSWFFGKDDLELEKTFLDRIGDLRLSEGFEKLNLFTNNFQYISALRSWDYESDDYAVEELNQISTREGKGELVAQFLHTYRNKPVLEKLKHEFETDNSLLKQVSAWEKEISNNVNVIPEQYGNSYEIKYSFNTNNEVGETDKFSKRNVGFGLSYALPVLVSILSADSDAFILIENPEAHIHAYGISKITELICLAAQAGIQVIVETHSDHVINGILVQCKKFEKSQGELGIDKDNLRIYHFSRNEEEHMTISKEIKVLEGGRTLERVSGFFDQIGNDLRELI